MGDFMPDAHVNGSLGCSFTALTCNNSSAIFKALSLSLIMGQKYKVFSDKSLIHINDSPKKNIHLLDVKKIQDFKAFTELTKNGEIQITDALNIQAKQGNVIAYKFKGKRFDCGSVEGYLEANNYFASILKK